MGLEKRSAEDHRRYTYTINSNNDPVFAKNRLMKNLRYKILCISDIHVSSDYVHIDVQLQVDSKIWWAINNQIRGQVFDNIERLKKTG